MGRKGACMTDHQFYSIIDMVDMILDGCRDLEEAQKKIKSLKRHSDENQGTDREEE